MSKIETKSHIPNRKWNLVRKYKAKLKDLPFGKKQILFFYLKATV